MLHSHTHRWCYLVIIIITHQSCHEAAEITIPKPDKRGKENIKEIEELSSKQKKILNDIESTSDEKSGNMLKNERKTIQKTIRTLLQQKETE